MRLSIYRDHRFLRGISISRGTLRIGRLPSCEVLLQGDGVARYHAFIEQAIDGSWRIVSLGFIGTRVNGKEVSRARMTAGDEVSIGAYQILVSEDGSARVDPREIIRHPNIYQTRRVSVVTAPAARSRPDRVGGESEEIELPELPPSSRFGWLGMRAVMSAIGSVVLRAIAPRAREFRRTAAQGR